jgi:hypothetical protein
MTFKVIKGGGPRPPGDRDVQTAAGTLRTLTIELLRALARGNDPQRRITDQLLELYKNLGKAGIGVDTVVESFLGPAHAEIATAEAAAGAGKRDWEDIEGEIDHILLASFQVAAERLCFDDAAHGRASQRMRSLEDALKARLYSREKRSRKHGSSYLETFLKQHFPKPSKLNAALALSRLARQPGGKASAGYDYDADAYERWQKHEITMDQLPPGKYPDGTRIYADGEWEAIVRSAPMKKREITALGAYVAAKGTVGHVKGGGWLTTERLAARGFVEIIQDGGGNDFPFYGVTLAGEAEWHRLNAEISTE